MIKRSRFFIKLCNAVILLILALCLLYILYSGLTATFDWALMLAILVVIAEGVAILLNHGCCPFAIKAEDDSSVKPDSGENTGVVPWCSRCLFWIYAVVFAIGIILLLVRGINRLA